MTKRRIYLALTVECPATVGEAEVEQAINSALDEDGEGMERAWGEWVVGAATIEKVEQFEDEDGPQYAVYWDNGNGACGTFPQRFDTEEAAEAFADDWAFERNLEDLGLTPEQVEACGGEGCYTAEAVEVDTTEEELDRG